MKRKRILLMYISEISGHRQATVAIEKSLKMIDATLEIRNINGFGYAYPIVEKIINKAYTGIIKRTPKIWDYLYDNPKILKRTQGIKEAIHKANHAKFARLFDEFKPDTVICTQAFPCGMVADYKKTFHLDTILVGVLTDYAPHSYWLHEGVDYYVVPSTEAQERFVNKGVPPNRIKVFGIPVDPKFCSKLDKSAIAQKLGLNENLPTLLVMGGGQGLGPIKQTVKALIHAPSDFQLIVVSGTNKKLYQWLKKNQSKSPKKILCYHFTENMEELMEAATLIITKPGGMTTTEALVKGLPMVIIQPLPGQEMHNTNFLIEKEVAIRVNDYHQVTQAVTTLLNNPQRLLRMRAAALENSKPHSSFDIAEMILQQEQMVRNLSA